MMYSVTRSDGRTLDVEVLDATAGGFLAAVEWLTFGADDGESRVTRDALGCVTVDACGDVFMFAPSTR